MAVRRIGQGVGRSVSGRRSVGASSGARQAARARQTATRTTRRIPAASGRRTSSLPAGRNTLPIPASMPKRPRVNPTTAKSSGGRNYTRYLGGAIAGAVAGGVVGSQMSGKGMTGPNQSLYGTY